MSKAEKLDYGKLFDPTLNQGLTFGLLRNIIENNYEGPFENVFGGEPQKKVVDCLKVINSARRASAHSYDDESENWTEEDFLEFREAMSWLETCLKEYE